MTDEMIYWIWGRNSNIVGPYNYRSQKTNTGHDVDTDGDTIPYNFTSHHLMFQRRDILVALCITGF